MTSSSASLTAWFYLTPVLYPLRLAPGRLRAVVRANPATGMVELFRAAIAGADPHWPAVVGVTCIWVAALTAASLAMHRRYNRVFADLL